MIHKRLDNPNSEGYKAVMRMWDIAIDYSDDNRTRVELLGTALTSYMANSFPDDLDLDVLEKTLTLMFDSMKEVTLLNYKENRSRQFKGKK